MKLIFSKQSILIVFLALLSAGCGGGGGGGSTPALSVSITSPAATVTIPEDAPQIFQAAASGGTAPYTYQWTTSGTGNSDTNSCSITYADPGNDTVTLTVTDSRGASSSVSWTVTVTDATAPVVSTTFPADTVEGIALNSAVSAIFNESMDQTTLTEATFTLTYGVGPTSVSGTVSKTTTTATFMPDAPLLPNTGYTATITTGAKDQAGNSLAVNKTWTFTTPPGIISGGRSHTLAIKTNGSLWAWGDNDFGQLGDNSKDDSIDPKSIDAGVWKSVAAGATHSAGIKNDGKLYCWGNNDWGQLGDGTNDERLSPVQEDSENDTWIAVSAGYDFTIALRSDGTLWAWGDNTYGQLGVNPAVVSDRNYPDQIAGTWAAISAGQYHCLALKKDGSLWAWGRNNNGQLGSAPGGDQFTPVQIGTTKDWTVISAGNFHNLALKNTGTLYSWGGNNVGQLGRNTGGAASATPQAVDGATDWISIKCGIDHSLGLKSSGALWAWGENAYGQLARDDGLFAAQDPAYTLVQIAGVWTGIYSGAWHNFGTKSDDLTIWAWGTNQNGELGDGASGVDIDDPLASDFDW
jgi:alpha-tubulin suppressor-like RCC1 family protein